MPRAKPLPAVSRFQLLLLCLSLVLLLPALAEESFRDFAWPLLQNEATVFSSSSDYEPTTKEAPFRFEARRWLKIKKLYLESAPPAIKNQKWSVVKIATPYRLVKMSSSPDFFNDSLVRLTAEPKTDLLFRPVEVTTGCDSGCTPVTFHLKYDGKSRKLLSILQEKEFPLRKAYHEKLSKADIAKLLTLAQQLPDALQKVEHPGELTDPDSGFPRQTWTFARPLVVENAAYTSYRIFEAALKTQKHFNASTDKIAYATSVRQKKDWFADFLAVKGKKEATRFFNSTFEKLNSAHTESPGFTLQTRALPILAAWIYKEHGDAQPLHQITSFPFYESAGKNTKCKLLKVMVRFESGRVWLKSLLSSSKKNTPQCSTVVDKILKFLARSYDQENPQILTALSHELGIRTLAKQMDASDPELQKMLLSKLFKIYTFDEKREMLAQWQLRFPMSDLKFLDGAKLVQQSPLYAADLEREEKVYRQRLTQKLTFFPRQPLRPLRILSGQKLKPKTFDAKKAQKRIVIFFASWCPHCQQFAKKFSQSPHFKKLLPLTQFIEIYRPGGMELNKFCKISELSDTICSQILRFPVEEKEFSRFAQTFAFTGVPRVFILDESGGVATDNFSLEVYEGEDLIRNLLWITEESSVTNSSLRVP